MRMKHAILCLPLVLATSVAVSHHAVAPVYDVSRTVTIQGIVNEFRFANPHVFIVVDVTDSDGNQVEWTVESAGRLALQRRGWTEESVAVGERVTIIGVPTHSGSPGMFLRSLVRSDGTEVLLGSNDDETLEDLREQRRQRREQ